MHSHHSHCGQFCKHAVGDLSQVVDTAISRGFTLYGLSEHVPRYRTIDLYPEESTLTTSELEEIFKAYIKEAHRLKELHSKELTILVGLETDYITTLDLDRLETLLEHYGDSIEYIVGSIHHVNEIPIDFDLPTYEKALASLSSSEPSSLTLSSINGLISSYLDSQYTLMTRFHPEIIGHFDLFRLYAPNLSLSSSSFPSSLFAKLERNIKYAVEYGALFEANAAAFRKGWKTAYPGEELAKLIISLGGRFALSDDSHGPHAVGLNYHRLRTYLHDTLQVDIYHLERCEEQNKGGRKVRAVKYDGSWWEDPFWKRDLPASS